MLYKEKQKTDLNFNNKEKENKVIFLHERFFQNISNL